MGGLGTWPTKPQRPPMNKFRQYKETDKVTVVAKLLGLLCPGLLVEIEFRGPGEEGITPAQDQVIGVSLWHNHLVLERGLDRREANPTARIRQLRSPVCFDLARVKPHWCYHQAYPKGTSSLQEAAPVHALAQDIPEVLPL